MSATSSPKKMIAPRLDCPICHSNAHVVRNGHKHGKQAYICRQCGTSVCYNEQHFAQAHTLVLRSGPRFWKRRSGGPLWIRRSSHLPAMDARSAIAVCSSCGIRSCLRSRTCRWSSQPRWKMSWKRMKPTFRSPKKVRGNLALMPVRKPASVALPHQTRPFRRADLYLHRSTAQDWRSDREIRKNRARPSSADVVDIYTGHVQKGTLF